MPYRTSGIVVSGFTELQRTFERIEGGRGNFGVSYELQHRLRNIGEHAGEAAKTFITHKTGPGTGRLADSVRVSVTKNAASVYSTSDYGGAQQYGAGPRAGWDARGPHIQRRNASRWMSKGVASQRPYIREQFDSVVDWVLAEVRAP